MRKTRAVGLTALAAVVTLVAGCSSVGGGSTSSSTTAAAPAESETTTAAGSASGGATSDTINVGLEQASGGFNGLSTGAASVYTAYVDNVLQGSFATIQPDTTIKPNPEFGTYEKTSD